MFCSPINETMQIKAEKDGLHWFVWVIGSRREEKELRVKGGERNLTHQWGEYKLVQPLWITVYS